MNLWLNSQKIIMFHYRFMCKMHLEEISMLILNAETRGRMNIKDIEHSARFNTNRKQQITNTKSGAYASISCIFTSRRGASIQLVTPELGFCGLVASPSWCSWTMADVISPLHKASKHLCEQQQRKKMRTVYWEHWKKKIKAVLKKVTKDT